MFVIADKTVSLIIFVLGVFIIVFSLFSLRIIYKNTVFHNAFGYICAAQSIAEAIVGICFAFWASPIIIFNPSVSSSIIGYWIGHVLLYCYFLAIWLHLCKSINRCIAIVFPMKYRANFTTKNAKKIIVFVMGFNLCCIGTSFFYQCNIYFDTTEFLWTSRDKQCFERIGKYSDRAVSFSTAGGSILFDIITWIHLLIINKKLKQTSATNSVSEKRFFVQTFLVTVFRLTTLFCSHLFICWTDNLSAVFILETVGWLLFHLINQFLFMVFSIKTKSFEKRISIFSLSSKVRAFLPTAK